MGSTQTSTWNFQNIENEDRNNKNKALYIFIACILALGAGLYLFRNQIWPDDFEEKRWIAKDSFIVDITRPISGWDSPEIPNLEELGRLETKKLHDLYEKALKSLNLVLANLIARELLSRGFYSSPGCKFLGSMKFSIALCWFDDGSPHGQVIVFPLPGEFSGGLPDELPDHGPIWTNAKYLGLVHIQVNGCDGDLNFKIIEAYEGSVSSIYSAFYRFIHNLGYKTIINKTRKIKPLNEPKIIPKNRQPILPSPS